MYRKIVNYVTAIMVCTATIMFSCRQDSDDVMCYAYDDAAIFKDANSSLEGQFKAIWMAMNCNYPIWDYEEQQGLNWDDVYDKYLPRFRELDAAYNTHTPVPDSILLKLYDEIFTPLHDGHLSMYLKNIHTEKKIEKSISPQFARNENVSHGESNDLISELNKEIEKLYLKDYFKPSLIYYENNDELADLIQKDDYIYACFKDGIVYLRIPDFKLTQTDSLWKAWFNCIQKLHLNDSLKGVIIDVRNNGGGSIIGYQYTLGALHEGDDEFGGMFHKIGYYREKKGIGRRDFSQLQPATFLVYNKQHVSVDVPIVVLSNDYSASMAEIITLSAKQLNNGYVIGTQTYGAFSPLDFDSYACTYTGIVGDPSLADKEEKSSYFAPFYLYIPAGTFLSLDEQILEGIGVVPNEIVHLDTNEHMTSYRDNQLDRALEYIRTGK